MEGWLYIIRYNRIGLQYSRKRYFILDGNCLKRFKSIPSSEADTQEQVRSAIIDSCIRITDEGRESSYRKVFFIFSLHNTSNHKDQLKLGATSPEEAAKWIHSLRDVARNPEANLVSCSKRKWQPFRAFDGVLKRTSKKESIDWISAASMHVHAMTSDVIAPSPWQIFGCQNGLRLFKESKERNSSGRRRWDDPPALMAVGVVDGTSEAIFQTVMSLGSSRSEWDFCFCGGSVIEHLNGHTDIIHMKVYNDWRAWGAHRRDFLLRRYWRREDDGTYVILYHSVYHRRCPPHRGYVRACLKSGGYVISPVNNGKESVVKHMLAIDWKLWKPYLPKPYARSRTVRMLERVAAMREMFKIKAGNSSSECPSENASDSDLPQIEKGTINKDVNIVIGEEKAGNEREKLSGCSSLMDLHNMSDEFYDVPDPIDEYQSDNEWTSDMSQESQYRETTQPKFSKAANFVKKFHDRTVHKKGYKDLQELSWEENVSHIYGSTLPNDSRCTLPCSWAAADPSTFLIREKSYLKDGQKGKAKGTLMEFIGADWIKSNKREDDLGGRPGGITQKYAVEGGPEFFFIINIQVPGTPMYSLAFYYMMSTPLEECPLLENFVNGDDAYRNSRFKLIPYISKGSWIVKQSVGKKACLLGQALQVNYFRGKNYLELDVDVGSSTVARGVISLVLGYLNNLVIEMAFLIQADTYEELPEMLLGTCRLNHLDAAKSVPIETMPDQRER
ncbi:protein ENHANCED DISEASE RESISTANCE 2-like [Apium graveolens]|uniref:protein ENHANCED DISEASE RESISTANCE 2-like n=1 Tax=Apium graveolens TaxID=4045 RepID=UPI003D7971FB